VCTHSLLGRKENSPDYLLVSTPSEKKHANQMKHKKTRDTQNTMHPVLVVLADPELTPKARHTRGTVQTYIQKIVWALGHGFG